MPARARKSTSVRALQDGLGLLERIAPSLGARLVERIWFTIPARRRSAVDWPAGGTSFELAVGGGVVHGHRWGAREDIVYLVHGWGGSGAQLGAFVSPLIAAGFSVVAYDALSHGQSDPGPTGPRRSTVLEQLDVLRGIAGVYGPPAGVIAHSLGSMVAAMAMRDGIVPHRAVYIAPMTDATAYTQTFTHMLGAGQRTWTHFVRRLQHRFGLSLDYFDVAAIGNELTTPPLLVIHDRDDQETHWAASRELVREWPNAQLMSTAGLGHNRILVDPAVVAASVAFLRGATITDAAGLVGRDVLV